MDESALLCLELARYYHKTKSYDQAHDYYEDSIKYNPYSSAVFCDLGFLFLEMYDAESAHSCFERSLEINTEFLKTWLGLAILHYSLGEVDLAWSTLQRLLDREPLNPAAISLALKWSVEISSSQEAITWLLRLNELLPEDSSVLLALAKIHYELGFYGKASIYAQKCLNLSPGEQQAQLFL